MDAVEPHTFHGGPIARNGWKVSKPPIKIFCPSEDCVTENWFDCYGVTKEYLDKGHTTTLLTYRCRHCKRTIKYYAVKLSLNAMSSPATDLTCAVKFGEWPPYGQNPPRRLRKLLGEEDFDFLSKGLRTESQGLGIAAFAYYRRVVENQKNALFDAIINIAQATGSPEVMVKELMSAKTEKQFDKAVNSIKSGIPDALLINHNNPLTLLHSALSVGLHEESDDECLRRARVIRLVLYTLAERLNCILADHSELQTAITELAKAKAAKRKAPDGSAL